MLRVKIKRKKDISVFIVSLWNRRESINLGRAFKMFNRSTCSYATIIIGTISLMHVTDNLTERHPRRADKP